jgi:hypothetical protein
MATWVGHALSAHSAPCAPLNLCATTGVTTRIASVYLTPSGFHALLGAKTMSTFHTFPTSDAARAYRHDHGTGGWIFSPNMPEPDFYPLHESILFPPEFTPSMIFRHPFTRGRDGQLIGN